MISSDVLNLVQQSRKLCFGTGFSPSQSEKGRNSKELSGEAAFAFKFGL